MFSRADIEYLSSPDEPRHLCRAEQYTGIQEMKNNNTGKITTKAIRRGEWRSCCAYKELIDTLRFPPFDITVMTVYDRVCGKRSTFWNLQATSNGSFFLHPEKPHPDKKVLVRSPNGRSAKLSVRLSGMVATLFAFAMIGTPVAVRAYNLLLLYALEQSDGGSISELLD